ncbi:hypothetical protein MTO96_042820, partial [Rhipicephalus appendiculatus]
VDIGRGLMVKKAAWEYVQCDNKDYLFVKDLLVTVWSKDVLKERSLQVSAGRDPRTLSAQLTVFGESLDLDPDLDRDLAGVEPLEVDPFLRRPLDLDLDLERDLSFA